MNPWKLYQYLYYILYRWNLRLLGESDVPEFNAAAGLSISLMLNAVAVLMVLEILGVNTGIQTFPAFVFIIIGALLLVLNYLIFVHTGRYKTLPAEFPEKESWFRVHGLPLIYLIGSLILFVLILMIRTTIT